MYFCILGGVAPSVLQTLPVQNQPLWQKPTLHFGNIWTDDAISTTTNSWTVLIEIQSFTSNTLARVISFILDNKSIWYNSTFTVMLARYSIIQNMEGHFGTVPPNMKFHESSPGGYANTNTMSWNLGSHVFDQLYYSWIMKHSEQIIKLRQIHLNLTFQQKKACDISFG